MTICDVDRAIFSILLSLCLLTPTGVILWAYILYLFGVDVPNLLKKKEG